MNSRSRKKSQFLTCFLRISLFSEFFKTFLSGRKSCFVFVYSGEGLVGTNQLFCHMVAQGCGSRWCSFVTLRFAVGFLKIYFEIFCIVLNIACVNDILKIMSFEVYLD